MATLADELLNDFEDSGSERGEDQNETLDEASTPPTTNGTLNDGMILDGDEEEDDAAMEDHSVGDADDQEEAKAKVEKMQLGGVSDVRNVAGLMKTLEPVLEVSSPNLSPAASEAAFTSLAQ